MRVRKERWEGSRGRRYITHHYFPQIFGTREKWRYKGEAGKVFIRRERHWCIVGMCAAALIGRAAYHRGGCHLTEARLQRSKAFLIRHLLRDNAREKLICQSRFSDERKNLHRQPSLTIKVQQWLGESKEERKKGSEIWSCGIVQECASMRTTQVSAYRDTCCCLFK